MREKPDLRPPPHRPCLYEVTEAHAGFSPTQPSISRSIGVLISSISSTFRLNPVSPFFSCLGAVGRIRPSPFALPALGPLLNALYPQLAVWGCEEKAILGYSLA
jgi:hypothetical protein